VIYYNWDNIVTYFSEKIERIRKAFDEGLLNGVFAAIAELNPFQLMADAAEALFTYLTGWTFSDITFALVDAFESIDLSGTGKRIMTSLWEGMKSVMTAIVDWANEKLDAITPDWLRSPDAGGAAVIGGPGDYGGMAGAMDGADAFRELGGPVRAGQIYRWQERGAELFVPRTDGTVISNRQLRAMRGGGGGRAAPAFQIGAIHVHAAPGQSERQIARAVRRELEQMARAPALHDGGFHDG
jgi:hypothetical protein